MNTTTSTLGDAVNKRVGFFFFSFGFSQKADIGDCAIITMFLLNTVFIQMMDLLPLTHVVGHSHCVCNNI